MLNSGHLKHMLIHLAANESANREVFHTRRTKRTSADGDRKMDIERMCNVILASL